MHLKFGSRRIALPASRLARVTLGVLLVCGGFLGFLPVLGFWMAPLGIIILSVDIPVVRRFRRKLEVRWGRWRQRRRQEKAREQS